MINVESSRRRRMIVWDKAKDDEMSIALITKIALVLSALRGGDIWVARLENETDDIVVDVVKHLHEQKYESQYISSLRS
jgi:hypothetical protein